MEKYNNKPIIRFPWFEGMWEKVRLKDVSAYFNGGSFENDVQEEGKYELVTLKSIDTSGNLVHSKRFIDIEAPTLTKDTLVMILSEQVPGLLGMTTLIPTDNKYVLNQRVAEIRPNEKVESYFLSLAINRNQKYFSKHGAGTKVQNISKPNVENYSFLCPTLPEQQKIATFFTAIDQKILQLKKKHQLLEQYKKGVMQKIFSQQIRFKDDDGREFPKWEKKRLGEVLYEHKTLNSKGDFQEVFSVAKHRGVVNQIEHLGRSFSAKDVSNYKVIYPNDVVYTKSPTSDFPFGIIKQNLTSRTGIVSPLYGVFRPVTVALGFLLHNYFLSWVNTYNYLNPLVQKGAKNTMNINNNDFLNGARISLPVSVKEQTKIANFLLAIDNKIQHTQKQVEQAEQWKKGLMQKMFV